LKVLGLLLTMFDPRTKHGKEVLRDLLARYDLPLVGAPVRKSIRFAEAPAEGRSVLALGQSIPGAAAYRIIARELLGEPVADELWEEALWDPVRRAAILDDDVAHDGVAHDEIADTVEADDDVPTANGQHPAVIDVADDWKDEDALAVIDLDADT
jgi:hypothetical protein